MREKNSRFIEGDIVKLKDPGCTTRRYVAGSKATAVVTGFLHDYIVVRWDKENEYAGAQFDGGYNQEDFELAKRKSTLNELLRNLKNA